jgi:pteridine reductase
MPQSLKKVVLVTGAARRIGAAIACRLHADGWAVALHCGASVDEAQALAARLNAARAGSAAVFPADLREHDAAARLIGSVSKTLGAPQALVNNASSYFPTPIQSVNRQQIDDLLATNFIAPLLLTQAALAAGTLQSVVNVLDAHVRHQPRAGFAAYTAAKGALWTLTESLAVELAPAVTVNGVALGHIAAEVRAVPSETETVDLADKAQQLPRVPMGRFGTPEDVAAAVAWLLTAEASYLTGAVIPVDGGRRLA